MSCACGTPRKCAEYVEAVIGRDVPGGTETGSVHVYLCEDHAGEPITDHFRFDGHDGWDVLEEKRVPLR